MSKKQAEDTDMDDEGNYTFTLDCYIPFHGGFFADVQGDHASYEVISADDIDEAKAQLEQFYKFVLEHYKLEKKKLDFEEWLDWDVPLGPKEEKAEPSIKCRACSEYPILLETLYNNYVLKEEIAQQLREPYELGIDLWDRIRKQEIDRLNILDRLSKINTRLHRLQTEQEVRKDGTTKSH